MNQNHKNQLLNVSREIYHTWILRVAWMVGMEVFFFRGWLEEGEDHCQSHWEKRGGVGYIRSPQRCLASFKWTPKHWGIWATVAIVGDCFAGCFGGLVYGYFESWNGTPKDSTDSSGSFRPQKINPTTVPTKSLQQQITRFENFNRSHEHFKCFCCLLVSGRIKLWRNMWSRPFFPFITWRDKSNVLTLVTLFICTAWASFDLGISVHIHPIYTNTNTYISWPTLFSSKVFGPFLGTNPLVEVFLYIQKTVPSGNWWTTPAFTTPLKVLMKAK